MKTLWADVFTRTPNIATPPRTFFIKSPDIATPARLPPSYNKLCDELAAQKTKNLQIRKLKYKRYKLEQENTNLKNKLAKLSKLDPFAGRAAGGAAGAGGAGGKTSKTDLLRARMLKYEAEAVAELENLRTRGEVLRGICSEQQNVIREGVVDLAAGIAR